MRMGLIGGTFDPIHLGHLIIAQEACTRLDLLQMMFVPAGQPPHKRDQGITDPERRFEMVRLAVADNPLFSVSRMDIDRAGPCYTVDTVRLFRDTWGSEVEIYLLIGADSLSELPTWHRPDLLIRLCHVVALGRPGYRVDWAELDRSLPGASEQIQMLGGPALDISSTEIRNRVRDGRPIRYVVSQPVERYIHEHRLYHNSPQPDHPRAQE